MTRMYKILISISLIANLVVARGILDLKEGDAGEKLAPKQMIIDDVLDNVVFNLRKLEQSNNIEIVNGISLVRNTPMESTGKSLELSKNEISNGLPKNVKKTMDLLGKLLSSIVFIADNHSVKIDEQTMRSLDEARTKLKKFFLPLLVVIGTKILAFMPIWLGGLTIASVKAYFISKLALLSSLIFLFQKFTASSTGSSFDQTPQYAYDNGAASNWQYSTAQYGQQNKRNAVDNRQYVDAQELAYAGYAPGSK